MSMLLHVTVVPKSGRFWVEKRPDGGLKVHLKSAPEGNKANMELIKEMRRLLGAEVRLVSGAASRRKVLEVLLGEQELKRILEM
jgi:uncharacterized protein (TIGR00251 family)